MNSLIQKKVIVSLGLFWLFSGVLHAAKIGELVNTSWTEQAIRFWNFTDPAVRYAFFGAIFMGISCGLLGGFIVVRKLALVGDTLSHAVLPGVAVGFLWAGGKDVWTIFIGATIAGLLGTTLVSLIVRTTRIREDSALGMVLAGFFAIGICLLTIIQNLEISGKAGLDKFMFGQAAALAEADIVMMGVVAAVALVLVILLYKEFLILSFDRAFGAALGLPVRILDGLLMFLLACSVVISLQACGVVLVSAMLITPAAAAYLLTDRMHRLLAVSVMFGCITGILGSFFSFLGNNLPTGPFMVIAASLVFFLTFLFAPRYGIIPRRFRWRVQCRRVALENTLKAVYHALEVKDFSERYVTLGELSQCRNTSTSLVEQEVDALVRERLAFFSAQKSGSLIEERAFVLEHKGWVRACEIVRNHRLWEFYLTHEADYAVDHVHEDAEKIEHILGESAVRALERKLNFPRKDPHGKLIPRLEDIHYGNF